MGLERTAVSTKVSPEIEEFLYEWTKSLRPYEVSHSSLMNKCAEIVMCMVRRGELSLEPKELQRFLENAGNGSNAGKTKNGKERP